MGILPSKLRIMDSIITQEGRKQMSSGKLNIQYVSFSDQGAIYSLDTIVSGANDSTYRLCFEATNSPYDQIIFEADDSGRLLGNFIVSGSGYKVAAGQIFSGSLIQSSSQFNSFAKLLVSSSINNFKNQYILQSPDLLDDRYDDFNVSPTNINYEITKHRPISPNQIQEIDIDSIESLFFDKRLSHIPNFQFLPPKNKARPGETTGTPLGEYISLNQTSILTFNDLAQELKVLKAKGFEQEIYFSETSRQNNLISQFFEFSNDQITKLDVIDFGIFPGEEDSSIKHVFFVGKVFLDSNNTSTFVNLFILVFEN